MEKKVKLFDKDIDSNLWALTNLTYTICCKKRLPNKCVWNFNESPEKNEFEWVEEVHVVNIHKEEASLGKKGLYFLWMCIGQYNGLCYFVNWNILKYRFVVTFFSFLKTRIGSFFGCTSQQKLSFSKVLIFF